MLCHLFLSCYTNFVFFIFISLTHNPQLKHKYHCITINYSLFIGLNNIYLDIYILFLFPADNILEKHIIIVSVPIADETINLCSRIGKMVIVMSKNLSPIWTLPAIQETLDKIIIPDKIVSLILLEVKLFNILLAI